MENSRPLTQKEIEFKESLRHKTADELTGMLVEYCSRDRYLYSIKKLGFVPKSKWFEEEIFYKRLVEE